MQYVPYVEVHGADGYRYWNPLTREVCATYETAQAVIAAYVEHKKNGTGGYRQGAPGRTKISGKG